MASRVWDALRTPFWTGRIVFLVGAVTLISAVLPGFRDRTELIKAWCPRSSRRRRRPAPRPWG
jgi:hypothetical protein